MSRIEESRSSDTVLGLLCDSQLLDIIYSNIAFIEHNAAEIK